MFKKLVAFSAMAAFIVACGGPSQAEIEAKAKATADSLATVMRQDSIKAAEMAAEEAAAAAAAAAAAVADSLKADSIAKAAMPAKKK